MKTWNWNLFQVDIYYWIQMGSLWILEIPLLLLVINDGTIGNIVYVESGGGNWYTLRPLFTATRDVTKKENTVLIQSRCRCGGREREREGERKNIDRCAGCAGCRVKNKCAPFHFFKYCCSSCMLKTICVECCVNSWFINRFEHPSVTQKFDLNSS